MLNNLDFEENIQFGIDYTYKIIPKSFKPFKLMTIYNIQNKTNIPNIVALIFIKYNDAESLKKLFSLLRTQYKFSPKFITTDFDGALIKALKECDLFMPAPKIIPCLFYYSQSLVKNLKKYNIMNKNFNKRAYEILRNYEILTFIDNEKAFIKYYENTWLKKI